MRLLPLALMSVAIAGPAAAKTMVQELMMLEPGTRMEQRCNGHVGDIVRRDHRELNPDEVVAYAFSEPVKKGQEILATGAAFRSKGAWFHVLYQCRATPDGLGIESFSYQLGTKIPREEWDRHYLVQ